MFQKGIAKTLEHRPRKFGWIVAASLEHGDDFFKEQSLEPGSDLGIVEAFPHRFQSRAEGATNERGVGSIENPDLPQAVGSDIGSEDHRRMPGERKRGIDRLDGPEGERLGHDQQGIDAQQGMLTWWPGYDAIDERIQPAAFVREPRDGFSADFPSPGLGKDEVFQPRAVSFDQLAGQDPRGRESRLASRDEDREQFRRKGGRSSRTTFRVGFFEHEAGFRGVREDRDEIRIARDREHFVPFCRGKERTRDRADLDRLINNPASGDALDRDVISAARPIQQRAAIAPGRLHRHDRTDPELFRKEIGEAAEEIPRAELQDHGRGEGTSSPTKTGFFQIGTVDLMRRRYSRQISNAAALWGVCTRITIEASPAGT